VTNPDNEAARIKMLQKRQGVEAATMARVNKVRLQTLLDEVKNKDASQERYQASLECVSPFCQSPAPPPSSPPPADACPRLRARGGGLFRKKIK